MHTQIEIPLANQRVETQPSQKNRLSFSISRVLVFSHRHQVSNQNELTALRERAYLQRERKPHFSRLSVALLQTNANMALRYLPWRAKYFDREYQLPSMRNYF